MRSLRAALRDLPAGTDLPIWNRRNIWAGKGTDRRAQQRTMKRAAPIARSGPCESLSVWSGAGRGLRLGDDLAESLGLVHGEVCQHLAVNIDPGNRQRVDKA